MMTMSLTEWPKTKVKDLAEYITVGFVGSMSHLFCDDGVPLLRGQNIKPYSLDLSNLKFISLETHRKWKKSALLPGDVAIVRVGYPGTACVIPEGVGELNAASLVIVRPDKRLLDSNYLCYVINSPWGKSQVLGRLVGSAQQVFNTQTAADLEIPAPPLPTQRKIAGILSAYDDLIENNLRRIKILEEMAQSLYREWFVHFRFPGHESARFTDSSLGQIPNGWEVRTIDELAKRISVGKKYDQKTAKPTGAVPIFDQGKTGVIGYHNDQPGVDASETDPVIVFANHTCYQRLVHYPFSAIQNVLPFRANPGLSRNIYWLHHATDGRLVLNDYKGHWPEFAALLVIVPPAEVCQRFGAVVSPAFLEMLKLERAVEILRRTRDLLLPKLLSAI